LKGFSLDGLVFHLEQQPAPAPNRPKIMVNLQLTKYALHFQLGAGEITAIRKVLTFLAILPCVKVDIQLSISMPCSPAVNADLKDLSRQRLAKLKLG
jgi:hypothetical protein